MKWSSLFGTCLVCVSCVQTRFEVPTPSPTSTYTLLFPQLLRDPKDDVRDLMQGALADLDQELGGGVIEVRTLDEPMECWKGQRAIPRALCHTEAKSRMSKAGEDALIWGYALNAQAKVFLLFLSARGGEAPVQLDSSGQNGQLTRRDLLGWFKEAVLANLAQGGANLRKAQLLRERLFSASKSVAAKRAPRTLDSPKALRTSAANSLWAAELAHFAADISWALEAKTGERQELVRAQESYSAATGYYPEPRGTGWLNAEIGLAMSELRLGDQQRNVELLGNAVRHFAAAEALIPKAAPRASIELGRGEALLLAGEIERDAKRLWEAVSVLESSLASGPKEKLAPSSTEESSPRELVCRAALGAATLEVTYTARAREACERVLADSLSDTGSCKTAVAAKSHADLGQLLFLQAQGKVDFDRWEHVRAHLECARTSPDFSQARRITLTHILAQATQQLGIAKRDATLLKQAATLYRALLQPARHPLNERQDLLAAGPPEPSLLHQQLGLTLAFLGRLEPTSLTLTEALTELQLGFPEERTEPAAVRQAQLRAQLQLAALAGFKEPTGALSDGLSSLRQQLIFGEQPELWLDNALLSAFIAWQHPQSSAAELHAGIELAQLAAERASPHFPEHAEASRVLYFLLRLREAQTARSNRDLCAELEATQAFLSTAAPALPSASLWPSAKRPDLSRLSAELQADPKLTRACQKAHIPKPPKP